MLKDDLTTHIYSDFIRPRGIEPLPTGWKPVILPLNAACMFWKENQFGVSVVTPVFDSLFWKSVAPRKNRTSVYGIKNHRDNHYTIRAIFDSWNKSQNFQTVIWTRDHTNFTRALYQLSYLNWGSCASPYLLCRLRINNLKISYEIKNLA